MTRESVKKESQYGKTLLRVCDAVQQRKVFEKGGKRRLGRGRRRIL